MVENKRTGKGRPDNHHIKERQYRIQEKDKIVNDIDDESHIVIINEHDSGASGIGSRKPLCLLAESNFGYSFFTSGFFSVKLK